jgi:hypothetical protein
MRTLVKCSVFLTIAGLGMTGAGLAQGPGANGPVPAELVGTWSVSDGDLSRTMYVFRPNGTYELAVTINNKPEGKKYYLLESGTLAVQGMQMTLTARSASLVTEVNGQRFVQPGQLVMRSCQWQIGRDFVGTRVLNTTQADGSKAGFYEIK